MVESSTTQVLSILIVLVALVVTAVLARRRREPFVLRRIRAYSEMPSFVSLAIESNRPMHLSFGSSGLGGQNTLLTVASAELAYYMTQRATIGDVSPILTVSDTSALPLAQDTLRRAYDSRGRVMRYQARSARWYPTGERSLAFAAAITAMMGDDRVSSNIMVGSYGPELALIMEASHRRQVPTVAVSDQLDGQAVAFALADAPLIGEEVFAAPAYLGDDPSQSSESVSIDVLRWLLVAALLVGVVIRIAGG